MAVFRVLMTATFFINSSIVCIMSQRQLLFVLYHYKNNASVIYAVLAKLVL